MSLQSKACRALMDSLDIVETLVIQNLMEKINKQGLSLDVDELNEVRNSIQGAVQTAKDRGVNQVIKATS